MGKNEILRSAAGRMLKEGVHDAEIEASLVEAGLSDEEAGQIIKGAKAVAEKGRGKGVLGGLFAGFMKPKGELGKIREKIVGGEDGGQWRGEGAEGQTYEYVAAAGNTAGGAVKGIAYTELPSGRGKAQFREIMPLRVSDFDKLVERGGLKRGDTILLSGGCGTGKTTFAMQSLYNAALHGEHCVYITLEESAEKMKENLLQNFGWDLYRMEDEGKLLILKQDPLTIARAVEAMLTKERGGLYIDVDDIELPFKLNLPFRPDRVVVDSLSALSIAFMENEQAYRQYLRHLFETLEKYNSVNIVLGETEQEPGVYSRSGIEEFLADGVIVLYNIRIHNMRERGLEILKLRSSNHDKKIVPYKITGRGIEVYIDQELFR
ncbi:MAG: ATPase domain-containing protein [Candidatus Diapherotrites archaeon]